MMRALFVHDTYYLQGEDGSIYAEGAFPYALWAERYLPHVDELRVIGRRKMPRGVISGERANGPRVSFHLLENINAPLKRLWGAGAARAEIAAEVAAADLVIVRGAAEFGMMAAAETRKQGKICVIELSGCAYDHTYYHGSLAGKLYAPLKFRRARHMVRHADAVLYVTQSYLQERYPASGHTAVASNVDLVTPGAEVMTHRLEKIRDLRPPIKIGMIGNTGNQLKGLGIAIAALGQLKDKVPAFAFHILGRGDPHPWQEQINRAGLAGQVFFDGTKPAGQDVLDWLDDMDFYLQPSLHEGLPRALIEAMSRGLPALASDAGGTPELLPPDNILPRGNAAALAEKLQHVLNNRDWYAQQAHLNFDTAKLYTREHLVPVRQRFYADVMKMVQAGKR